MLDDKIKIKTIFGEERKVNIKKTKEILNNRLYNISCKYKENTFKYINDNILFGIDSEKIYNKSELSPVIRYNIYGK